ncbi:MAG: hypothetical protein QNJ94_05585 [Alphaproteobacteria bacterium]|nr:hypothetical protein [Alphaproteobacteria bacterium]
MSSWRSRAVRWRRWRYVAWCVLLISLWIALMAYLAEIHAFGLGKVQILLATYLAIPAFCIAVVAIVLTTICEKRAEMRADAEDNAIRDAAVREAGQPPEQ